MEDKEAYQLFADEFIHSDQPEMAGLNCGDEPWSRAAAEWIKGSEVFDSIEKYGTQVWVFRNKDDGIVGFGSIGPVHRRWPPPNGDYKRLLIIPQLGIDVQYRGLPKDPDWRYSNQILSHLIFEAQQRAIEVNANRKPKKHVTQLILLVHKDNAAAQKVYSRFEFELIPDYALNDHLVMVHQLELG